MGCQTEVELGQNLTFTIPTHDAETAEEHDADEAPSYRVYESETAVPILTGTMDKLDDDNTVGFYAETIACTTVNGFEVNGSYNIRCRAIVHTIPGCISYGFRGTPAGADADSLKA